MANILCIDDEPAVGVVLEHHLTQLGHTPTLVTAVEEALRALARQPFDLVISDDRMPGTSGIELIERLRQAGHDQPVVLMAAYTSIEGAVLAVRHGAVDYLSKPLRQEALRLAVTNAIEVTRLRRENDSFRRELGALRGARPIVGASPALRGVLETIAAVAATRATVLLEGESGTGKELLARAVHEQSPRRDGAFVTVNCAALPEGLVESVLFGHERGSFTGATARQQGAFERAHGGTLLLDEISEMRLDLQAKLLRALQEHEIERVGGQSPVPVDVRVVATTNRDLLTEVQAGRFRRDLYYRLAVVPVHTPPLRERRDDIPRLIDHFVRLHSAQLGLRAPGMDPGALAALATRPWPGNVRELANAVERAVILSRGGPLTLAAFGSGAGTGPVPNDTAARIVAPVTGTAAEAVDDTLNLREIEKWAIERALERTGGHRARAAELLGISERTLRNRLNGPGALLAVGD